MKLTVYAIFWAMISISTFAQTSHSEVYVSGNIGMMAMSDWRTTESGQMEIRQYNGWFGNFDTISIPYSSNVSEEFDRGIKLTGSVGASLFDAARVELEVGYSKNRYRSTSIMNWDFGLDSENYGWDDAVSIIDTSSRIQFDGHLSSWTFMGNVYYDFKISNKFNLYIGAGLGMADFNLKLKLKASQNYVYGDNDVNEHDTQFAYQFMPGFSYALTEKTTIDLQYRYLKTKKPDFLLGDTFYTQSILVGLRRSF